ncbi:hypothetical protein [Arthrobacter sp. H14]|uniref:hypothetical protein n=1 Tax=Arthrobacter sp. H14 TaxID=1312959 RepID=UPI00047C1A37|nr:hypothetical protein [Arthrobacter sp. H14]
MQTPVPEPVEAPAAPKGTEVDFQSGWGDIWSSVTAGYPGIDETLTLVGVAIVVLSLIQWAWKARTGGAQRQAAKPVWGGLIIGSILAAPALLIPLLLGALDTVVNVAISLMGTATGA